MKRKTSIITVLFLCIGLILNLGGCGTKNNETTDTSSKAQQIVVGLMPDVATIPFIVAEKNGYFKEEGVDVKLEHFKSAQDRESALQGNKLDGVSTDALAVSFANNGGFPMLITSKTDVTFKLVVGKDSGISSIEDLKGKSIAISKNTIIEYVCDKILEKANIKEEDIKKEVIAKIPTRLEMLQNGKVDAAILPDPLATLAVVQGGKYIISTEELGTSPSVMAFTKEATENKADEIKAMYRAYNKAVEYIKNNSTDDFMDEVIIESGFPEVVKDTIVLPEYNKAKLPSEKDIKNTLNWLEERELIDSKYEVKDLMTDKFVR